MMAASSPRTQLPRTEAMATEQVVETVPTMENAITAGGEPDEPAPVTDLPLQSRRGRGL